MLKLVYERSPYYFQNFMVSIFNIISYQKRYGGKYLEYLNLYKKNRTLTLYDLKKIQKIKYSELLTNTVARSTFYNKLYADIIDVDDKKK